MIKVELPNGKIIERKPIAKSLGNFCQLYVRYKGKIYAVGDGDEYIRGMPEVFRLKYLASGTDEIKYILYPEDKEDMKKNPLHKDYYKNFIELPD